MNSAFEYSLNRFVFFFLFTLLLFLKFGECGHVEITVKFQLNSQLDPALGVTAINLSSSEACWHFVKVFIVLKAPISLAHFSC